MSSATLALPQKNTAIPFAERPASGRTTTPADEAQSLPYDYPASIQHRTWTIKSLLEKWTEVGVRQWQPGGASKPLASSTSASALTSLEYSQTLACVRLLCRDEDEQDRPSEEAYQRTVRLLSETARHVGMQFPRGIAATGPGRSVRLLWSSGEKELRLVLGGSATNRSYIYWRTSGYSGIDETIEASRLAQYLSRIVDNA
jgi:hypothetical protein